MQHTVFIHTNERQNIGALVAEEVMSHCLSLPMFLAPTLSGSNTRPLEFASC